MTKALSLISSGIDSPVSTYIMMKKGLDVICIHFDNQPFTDSRPREKALKQVEYLAKTFNRKIKFYIIAHGKNQAEFMRNTNRRFACIFCRRTMFLVAEKIAKLESCEYLITGENLGQVASQTLDNMAVTDSAVKIPILRPLLTNDKQETIDFAKKIGTFEVSIEKGVCCNAVPKKPATKAKQKIIDEEEKKVDINKIINNSVTNAEIIIVGK